MPEPKPPSPRAAPHSPQSPPSAATSPQELHVPELWLAACRGFQDFTLLCSLGVRVKALQQQEVAELQGRPGWKPGEVNDLQERFGCPGFCLLPELLLSFPNLLLYWKFKGSLEGSRNPLTFFLFLGEKRLFYSFSQKGVNSSCPLALSVVLMRSKDKNWSVWVCKSRK